MEKKYELTDETIEFFGHTLHRIKALRSFGDVKEGELGGFIEKQENLSQEGNCWVYGDAMVFGDARVCCDARVFGSAKVYGNAKVFGNAMVYSDAVIFGDARVCDIAMVFGDARVCDNAMVYGNAMVWGSAYLHGDTEIYGNAIIKSNKDYITFKNWWSSGRYFTWTRSNNKWKVGCFYGSGEELIKKAYSDSEDKGKRYEEIVNYVNRCVLGKS